MTIIDKELFTVRNCVSLVLLAVGCTSAWGVMTSRVSENKTELSSHSIINKSHVLNFIKLDAKIEANHIDHDDDLKSLSDEIGAEIKRTSYNNSQLSYRLTSANKNYIDEQRKFSQELKDLIHEVNLNRVKSEGKMDYIIIMLESQKDGKK